MYKQFLPAAIRVEVPLHRVDTITVGELKGEKTKLKTNKNNDQRLRDKKRGKKKKN